MKKQIVGSDIIGILQRVSILSKNLRFNVELSISEVQVVLSTEILNSVGWQRAIAAMGLYLTYCPCSILGCVGGTAKMSSSLLIHSQDCGCTKAILSEYIFLVTFSFFVWGALPTLAASRLTETQKNERLHSIRNMRPGRFFQRLFVDDVVDDVDSRSQSLFPERFSAAWIWMGRRVWKIRLSYFRVHDLVDLRRCRKPVSTSCSDWRNIVRKSLCWRRNKILSASP